MMDRMKKGLAIAGIVILVGFIIRLSNAPVDHLTMGQCLLSTTNGIRMRVEAINSKAYFLELWASEADIEAGEIEVGEEKAFIRAIKGELMVFIASGHLVIKSCEELDLE